MKKALLVLAVLAALTIVCAISAQADNNTCTVTWNSGEAAYLIGANGECTEKTTHVPYGYVIKSSDLPYVYPYAKTSGKYHCEWQGAVGTTVTEDITFNLVWVANYEGYYTVIWKSTVLHNYWLTSYNGVSESTVSFFCDIDLVEEGHTITTEDIERHSHYENSLKNMSYCFEWTVSEGEVIDKNNTVFFYNIEARDKNYVPVMWYNNIFGALIRLAGDTEDRDFVGKNYCLAEVFPKGHTLSDADLPTTKLYSEDYLYTCIWDGADGAVLNEGACFFLSKIRRQTARVRMYIDGEYIYDEILAVGTRITLPEVAEGHEEMRIYGWSGESGAGSIHCSAGEEFEVNFDVLFEADCVLWGDITHDGVTNTRDAVVVLKRIAQDKPFKILEKTAADMDKNDVINTRDAVLILQLVASR